PALLENMRPPLAEQRHPEQQAEPAQRSDGNDAGAQHGFCALACGLGPGRDTSAAVCTVFKAKSLLAPAPVGAHFCAMSLTPSEANSVRSPAPVGAHPVRDALARDTGEANSGRSPSATESL